MPDVRTATERDSTTEVLGVVAAHAAIIAVPVLVVALVLVPALVAVAISLLVAAVVTALRLRGVDDRLAAAMGARRLGEGERPRLDSVVESAAMAVGVAPPELFVVDEATCNAVAWGTGNGPFRCAFTTGLLDSMDRVELEAVVGHQLAVISEGGLPVVTIGTALFGPVATGPLEDAIAWAVHRSIRARSVVAADLDGVRATRYPPGLVAALEEIRGASTALASVPPTLSVLCFAAPTDGDGAFAVHPPVEDRIDLLREI